MLWLFLLIVLFLALPLDAQERLAQGVGLLVTHPYAPYVAAGGLGALVVTLAAAGLCAADTLAAVEARRAGVSL